MIEEDRVPGPNGLFAWVQSCLFAGVFAVVILFFLGSFLLGLFASVLLQGLR